jgi:drug/metabolite transporter (DMT)-like permease
MLTPGRIERRGQLLIALSALAWSTTGLLQRALTVDTLTQVWGRALFASLGMGAYVVLTERRRTMTAIRSIGWEGVASTACMVVASVSFIVALNRTSVAHVLIILAISPLFAALLGWRLLSEPIAPRTWLTMLVAFLGVGLMVGTGDGNSAFGDAMAFLMTLGFAINIIVTRRKRHTSLAPAAVLSQIVVVLATLPWADPVSVDAHDIAFLALLGCGSMGVGLIFLVLGARLIPAAEVALISLLEVVLGPLGVWLVYSETPGAATVAGGVIVLLAVAGQAARRPRRRLASEPAAMQTHDDLGPRAPEAHSPGFVSSQPLAVTRSARDGACGAGSGRLPSACDERLAPPN